MAKVHLKSEDDSVTTRDKYTKVNFALTLDLDGRELPPMAVLGDALEQAAKMIQAAVTESYQVPPRQPTTLVTPPDATQPAQPINLTTPKSW